MHDYEAHARALDADLEYYYTKRLMPLVLQLLRRRYIDLYDLTDKVSKKEEQREDEEKMKKKTTTISPSDFEARLRSLEDQLDEFVKGVSRLGPGWAAFRNVNILTNDTRKERGDYDPFFHVTQKKRGEGGSDLRTRIDEIERDLNNYRRILDTVTLALESKGLLDPKVSERLHNAAKYPSLLNGSKIVARAWTDPAFKERLLANAREAVRELGIPPGRLGQLHVVEDNDSIHNVIVCTLCSCYPYDLLGNAPWWYKQDRYKTRIIADPRNTLEKMFKFRVSPKKKILVHDSTSDVRYMVLPERPKGTSKLSEEELGKLVTRECLIGVGEPLSPSSKKN